MESNNGVEGADTAANGPSLTKQSLWILSAKTIGFFLSAILPLLVVRQLTQGEVGVYRQAFLIVVSATSILPLGFSMSAYYFLNRAPERRDSTILNIVLFNFVAGGLAFLLLWSTPSLLGALFRDDQMAAIAPAVGLAIWLAIFSTFLETAALANKETKLATAIIIFAQLSKAALMGAAAILFGSAEAIVYAVIVQGILQAIVLVIFLNARFPRFWSKFEWAFFKEHLRYALPFGMAALLYNAQTDLHHYFVANEFSSADYAIYAYGCFQLPLVWTLYESISAVLLPRMSELQSQGRIREMLQITVSGIHKLALTYFPLFVFLIIVADVFVTTLFTSNFTGSISIFRINLLLLPLYCLILDPLERSFKELGAYLTKIRTLIMIGLAVSLYFGVNNFGLTGVIAIVVSFVALERTLSIWRVAWAMDVRVSDIRMFAGLGRLAAAAAISGLFLFSLIETIGGQARAAFTDGSRAILLRLGFESGWDFLGGSMFLAVAAVIYGFAYLVCAVWLKAIGEDELLRIVAGIKRSTARITGSRIRIFGPRQVSPAVE